MIVKLIEKPSEADWLAVKRRALVTVGKEAKTPPTEEWKHRILEARHSPIRRLHFAFYFEGIPYWVAMHLRTHVHDCPNGDEFTPYVKSQRDDRQNEYPRGKAPQDQPVNLIIDMSAEQLMTLANKRLCMTSAPETRKTVKAMCALVEVEFPEFKGLLVPMCQYHGGVCHEMFPCGALDNSKEK